jgi:hypothetical protein
MYVATIPNRNSPPAILLRESFRQDGQVRKRTLANISDWPVEQIESLRRVLKGETFPSDDGSLDIRRSLPHGHVAAVVGTIRKLGLPQLIDATRSHDRELILAMVAARILEPQSKLATARGLDPATATTSLLETLQLESAAADDLYEAMDWLYARQNRIEDRLAERHLSGGTLVLYDVKSTYFEGRSCPLARLGHSRDERSGNLQIVFGLLANAEGCPVAVEVFEGNTGDPKTVAAQVSASSWSVIAACSPMPAFAKIFGRPKVSIGLRLCERRRFRRWLRLEHYSSLFLISAIWPRSPIRIIPENGSSPVAIRYSPPIAPASGRNCSPPPKKI